MISIFYVRLIVRSYMLASLVQGPLAIQTDALLTDISKLNFMSFLEMFAGIINVQAIFLSLSKEYPR